ncbi:5'-3' exoribonuclease 2-like, partial [Centruroides sculpturatus]|uniref:5'-3' exoribonuclease 2-like n=1 Tax=Centruroides sculpturatus TaxID=218467 RepID=UPI000C6E38FB
FLIGHEMKECIGLPKEKTGEFDELEKPIAPETEFIFIRLTVLREYLTRELRMPNLPFEYDFERAVDDWVFMCFFVGNDFLPHLPSLEIREGAIDRLVSLYKDTVYKTGGFLTNSGEVNLCRVQLIMTNLGEVEDEIFKKRQQTEEMFRARRKQENKRKKLMQDRPSWTPQGQFAPNPINKSPLPIQNARQEAYKMRVQGMQYNQYSTDSQGSSLDNKDAAKALKEMLKSDEPDDSKKSDDSLSATKGVKRKKSDDDSDEEEVPYDPVRLWEPGWKDRYYSQKFQVSPENIKFRQDVAQEYVKGLCWVLKYYYQGCPSWTWFFPYHYAPFASDFINIGDESIIFPKNTKPFRPLEQLMAVFPAASRQHIPEPWAELMIDPESPIIDFYPEDFSVDLNGKKFAWQERRNTQGDDVIYASKDHLGYDYMKGFYECENYETEYDLSPQLFQGMSGKILLFEKAVGPGDTVYSPIKNVVDIPNNMVLSMRFRNPLYEEDYIFKSVLLPNAKIPPPTLKPEDFERNREWRPQIGMSPANQRASLDISGRKALK